MRSLAWITLAVVAFATNAARADDVLAGPPLVSSNTQPNLLREMRLGLLAHDVDGLWSGHNDEDGEDIAAELIFEHSLFHLWSGVARPNIGVTINTAGDTSKVHAGFLWTRYLDNRWSFSMGLGLAWHTGKKETDRPDKKQLGSRILARIPIELGYDISAHHRLILAFDHISNAWLADENEGMDTLGLVYSYKF